MAGNIGATLSLKNGNFFTGLKSASKGIKDFKSKLNEGTGALKKHSSQANSTGLSLKNLAKKAVGVVGAYAGFREIVNFSKDCVSAADTQVRAETRLEQLMMNVKGTTLENVNAMKKYSSELQGVTTVGDEATIQGASQLATFQLQSDTIKKLLPSLQDLAVSQYGVTVSGDQMQQMANLMGKVMTGNVGSLTRYGVTMDETQKKILKTGTESQKASMLVEVMNKNFGGLAASMATTPEGKIVQIKNAWGDMQEVIGAKLYPVVTDFFGLVAQKMPSIQSGLERLLDSGVVEKAASSAFNGISALFDGIGKAAVFITEHWGLIKPILTGVLTGFVAFKGLSGLSGVFSGVSNGLNLVSKGLRAAKKASGFFNTMKAMGGVLSKGSGLVKGLGAAFTFLSSPVGIVIAVIGVVVAAFIYCWNRFEGFRNFWISAWEGIKNVASTVGEKIKGVFDSVKEKVMGFWNKIKDIWDKVKGVFTGSGSGGNVNVNVYGASEAQKFASGGIMRRPTMFGINGNRPMIGGEAGAEAILPLSQFWYRLGQFINSNNQKATDNRVVNNYFNISVEKGTDDEETVNTMVKKIKEVLNNM